MGVVFDVRIGGACVHNDHCGSGADFATDWVRLNGVTRGHVADKNIGGGGGRGSPMGWARLNGVRIGLTGRVRSWWGRAQWVPDVGW